MPAGRRRYFFDRMLAPYLWCGLSNIEIVRCRRGGTALQLLRYSSRGILGELGAVPGGWG